MTAEDPAGFFAVQPPITEPSHRVQSLRHWDKGTYEVGCSCGANVLGSNPFQAIDAYAQHRVTMALHALGVRPIGAPIGAGSPICDDPTCHHKRCSCGCHWPEP